VHFRLTDTGVGIAPPALDRIFEPYVQADDRVYRFYGGTGLGLGIVRKIIELQHGTIRVTSQEGEGTTIAFRLTWPVSHHPPPTDLLTPVPAGFQRIQRVLVGEDDPISQQVLQQLLVRWGLQVTVVERGQRVVAALQQHVYDLLIIDYHMPGLNGKEVIRAIPPARRPPTIMLSGDAQAQALEQNKAVIFLKKPVDPIRLQQEIANLDAPPALVDVDLNLDYLREITGHDPVLMVDLIDTFIRQVPREIAKMKTALKRKDWTALYLAVHKAKPNFKYVGVRSVQGILDQFEQDVEQRVNQTSYQEYLHRLEAFTKQTLPALEMAKRKIEQP
jgi:CheY-like chemotaxis protein